MGNTAVTAATNSTADTNGGMGIVDANLAVSAAIRTRGTEYGYVVDATNNNALANATVKLHKGNKNGPLTGAVGCEVVPEAGFEPARLGQRFLRPPRLPFRHSGAP